VLISRLNIEVPPREMPMSVLTFWEGKVLGVGAVDLLVSAVAGVWSVGAQGLVSIGFNASGTRC
jgi:hypothetical protein